MIIHPFTFKISDNKELVNSVERDLQAYSRIGIVGKVGSGKSLLIKLLADYRLHSSGAFSPTPFCAYLSQDVTRLFTGNTPGSILKMYQDERHQVGRHFNTAAFETFCKHLDIQQLMEDDRRLAHYSEGEKQRLGICLALAVDASVCILDEPTTALNRQHRDMVFKLVKERSAKTKILIISHRILDIMETCEAIIYMNNCQLQNLIPLEEIIDNEPIKEYFPYLKK